MWPCDRTVEAGLPLPASSPHSGTGLTGHPPCGSSPFSQHCCDTELRCTQLVTACFSPNLYSRLSHNTIAVERKTSDSNLLQIWKQPIVFSFAFKIRQNSSLSNKGPQSLSHMLFHLFSLLPQPPAFVIEVSLSLSILPTPPFPTPQGLCTWHVLRLECCPLPPSSRVQFLSCFQTSSPWPQPHHQIVIKQVCVHLLLTPLDYRVPLCFCPPCCHSF